jgi:outer membrane protein W
LLCVVGVNSSQIDMKRPCEEEFMKSRNLLALVIALSFSTAYAQNEEQVLNSDPIDVDGYLSEKQATDGELEQIKSEIRKQKNEVQLNKDKTKSYNELSKTTEKLSDTTEDYLDNKKSAQKDIAEYNAKIKCLMEENPGKDCDKYVRNRRTDEPQVQQEVQVQQAAATSVATAPASALTGAPFEEIKLIPYGGATQYNGKVEQLEAQLSAGLRLESNISTRFSMGMGINYSTLKTQDFANNSFSSMNFGNGYQSREIQYKSMGIDLYGKFFITKGERFRPYVGAGLGYNRSTSNYTENDPYSTFNNNNGGFYNFGNEEFRTSYFSGTVMGGTEILITKTFGINIEAAYATGLGNSVSSQASKNGNNNPDQNRLRELGTEIINAGAMSIFAGAVVTF